MDEPKKERKKRLTEKEAEALGFEKGYAEAMGRIRTFLTAMVEERKLLNLPSWKYRNVARRATADLAGEER